MFLCRKCLERKEMETAVVSNGPLSSSCSRPRQLHGLDHRDRRQLGSAFPRRALPGPLQPHLLLREVPHAGLGRRDEPLQDIFWLPGSLGGHAGCVQRDPRSGAMQRFHGASGKGQNPASGFEFNPHSSALLRPVPPPPAGAERHVSEEAVRLQIRGDPVRRVPRILGADEPELRGRPHFVLFRQRGCQERSEPSPRGLVVHSVPQALLVLAVARRHTERRVGDHGDTSVGQEGVLRVRRQWEDHQLQDRTVGNEGGVSPDDHPRC